MGKEKEIRELGLLEKIQICRYISASNFARRF